MYKKLSLLLALVLLSHSTAFAVGSKKAAYVGGTASAFKDSKKVVEGQLITGDEKELKFVYNKTQTFAIPYDQIIDLEYGKKSGRRVGTAVATTVLLGPIGLLSLMSKKQKRFCMRTARAQCAGQTMKRSERNFGLRAKAHSARSVA